MNQPIVWVYGSLKSGGILHQPLASFEYLGEFYTACDFRLYDLGQFPAMVEVPRGTGQAIHGEAYRGNSRLLEYLDHVEGTQRGLYKRRAIKIYDGKRTLTAFAYVWGRPLNANYCTLVESGIW